MEELSFLFEDQHLLAIHKPENIPFHSEDSIKGIVARVRDDYGCQELFPVHRLDRMTSGLMVFAKTKSTNSTLSQAIANKAVEKYYLAVSLKKPVKKQGMIKGDMEKSRRGSYKLLRTCENPALSYFFSRPMLSEGLRYYGFLLKPETGKTHQLRVALKAIGSPILGDERYGSDSASRGYLHAYMMRFELFGQRYCLYDKRFSGTEYQFKDLHDAFCDLDTPNEFDWPKKAYRLSDIKT